MSGRGWRIAAASAIGTSHIKQGTVCQDSHTCRIFEDGTGRTVGVFVVSDGAGSASRADEGSDITCRTLTEAVEVFLANGGLVAAIDVDMARHWLEMVKSAIAFRADETISAQREYACTLLAAVVAEDAAAFLQIGDGAMVVADETGEWSWIHWPQRGDYANTTYFVTDDNASDQMAFDLIERRVDEVAAFTDGIEGLVLHYATKTVHAPFFDKMFVPVRALKSEGVDQGLSAGLEQYLSSPAVCERTDDDKTLILATRRPPIADGKAEAII
jgi:hypothetical protein